MGKKKKPFIDKKKATTFHLVQRTQNDPNFKDGDSSQMVFQPLYTKENQGDPHIPADFPKDLLQFAEDSIPEPMNPMDFFIEEEAKEGELGHDYDYSRHMRTIGGGTVLENPAIFDSTPLDARRAAVVVEESAIPELAQESDFAMAINPEEPIQSHDGVQATREFFEALDDGGDEGDFEEILDDFVVSAMQDPNEEEQQELAAVARAKYGDYQDYEGEGDEYEGDEGDEGDEREEALDEKEQRERAARAQRPIDDEFEAMLEAYDDDEIGELDPDADETILGKVEDVAVAFEGQIEEYARRKEKNYQPGADMSGFSGDVRAANAAATDVTTVAEMTMNHLNKQLRDLQTEDDDMVSVHSRIDHEFAPVAKDKWDCESIISTYSNLENRPRIIPTVRRDKKKIQLSAKTGIPLGYYPSREAREAAKGDKKDITEEEEEEEEEGEALGNLGEKRSKAETKEDKKRRKAEVKAARREQRAKKKETKLMYSQETSKLAKTMVKQAVSNPNVKKLD